MDSRVSQLDDRLIHLAAAVGTGRIMPGQQDEASGVDGDAGGEAREPGSLAPSVTARTTQTHFWGGVVFLVPPEWRLPKANVATGWKVWMPGVRDSVPALRAMTTKFGPNVTDHDFSEWKVLYGHCEAFLKELNMFQARPSLEEVHAMFAKLEPLLESKQQSNSTTGRKKRPASELMVTSMARKFRKFSESDMRTVVTACSAQEG